MTTNLGQGQTPPAMGNGNQVGLQHHPVAAQQLAPGQQLAGPTNSQLLLGMMMAPQVAAGTVPPPVLAGIVWPGLPDPISVMWNSLSKQLDSGDLIIQIASDVVRDWHVFDVRFIINAYRKRVGQTGMLVRDANVNRILLGPARYFKSQALVRVAGQFPVLLEPLPGKESRSRSADAKVPRPPNAFIIYRKEHHPRIFAQNPGIRNNDISVIVGAMWQKEPIEVRDAYKAKSEELKARHLLAHPEYAYQPRKPSEKKRRKSKKTRIEGPSTSLQMAKEYQRMAHKNGVLAGNVDGVRTATLPAAESAFNQIEQHNDKYRESTRFEEARATPANVIPSAEYVAVQQADELIFDLATKPDMVSAYIDMEPTFGGLFGAIDDEYDNAAFLTPEEWEFQSPEE